MNSRHLLLSLAGGALVAVARTQPPQQWTLHDAHKAGVACFDPVRGRLVRVGGGLSTWEWDGVRWFLRDVPGQTLTTNQAPTSMVYATARKEMIACLRNGAALSIYDGASWRDLAVPAGLLPQTIAYDSLRQRLVLLGLRIGPETWEHDGVAWAQITTANSPPMSPFGSSDPMTFDPLTGKVLFWTSASGVQGGPSETWSYDGLNWSVSTTGSPPYRSMAVMGHDPVRGRLVFYGGILWVGLPTVVYDVWEWDGLLWTQVGNGPGPFFADTSLCFDTVRGQLLAGDLLGALHRWDGTTWSPVASGDRPRGGSLVADVTSGSVLLVTADDTWSWSAGAWSQVSTQPTGIEATVADATGLVFGLSLNSQPGYWVWAGSWIPITSPTVLPPTRRTYGLALDTQRQRAVMFGGRTQTGTVLGDTWEFDGVNWQQANPTQSPSPRYAAKMLHDPALGRTMLVGGERVAGGIPIGQADTWFWNGIDWLRPSSQPAPFVEPFPHDLLFDLRFDAAVGRPVADRFRDRSFAEYEHDGTDWLLRAQVTTTTTFDAMSVDTAVHPGRGTLVMHAGAYFVERPLVASSVATVGAGCGLAPRLQVRTAPRTGSAAFGFEVLGAPGPVLVGVAANPANVPLGGGCTLRLQGIDLSLFTLANSGGFAEFVLPVPDSPVFVGAGLFAQAAQLDPATPVGLALSGQLAFTIGG